MGSKAPQKQETKDPAKRPPSKKQDQPWRVEVELAFHEARQRAYARFARGVAYHTQDLPPANRKTAEELRERLAQIEIYRQQLTVALDTIDGLDPTTPIPAVRSLDEHRPLQVNITPDPYSWTTIGIPLDKYADSE